MNEIYTLPAAILVGIIGLAVVTYLVPGGPARLAQPAFWVLVGGTVLIPVAFVAATYHRSDNPALWVALGGFIALGGGALAFLTALFTPPSWGVGIHALIPLAGWTIIALALFLAGK